MMLDKELVIITSITKSYFNLWVFKLNVCNRGTIGTLQARNVITKGSHTLWVHFTGKLSNFKDEPGFDTVLKQCEFIKASFFIHVEGKIWILFCFQPHQGGTIINHK